MATQKKISQRAIERMSQYRRALGELKQGGSSSVYSHELANLCGLSAAQVRRDLMTIGYTGSSTRGYDVGELFSSVNEFMGFTGLRRMALVGVGHLGRALLGYFVDRNPMMEFTLAFDADPGRVNRVISGVRCHPIEEMGKLVKEKKIHVGLIAVPAEAAQEVAWTLVDAGVTGLLNFAPVQLRVPDRVYVENLDLTTALEKVAYYAASEK